ncbi:MAG: FGGY family carbohydrate kinase, partial [Nakamurella sp.]
MTDGPVWVGIDIGTQSVRAVAVSDEGAVVGRGTAPLVSDRSGDRHEQDPESWWTATVHSLRSVTDAVESGRIAAVAVSATSGTIVVTDAAGRPVTPGVMYDDARGAGWVDRVEERGHEVWSRLGYRMQASWALPTLCALVDEGRVPTGSRVLHQPDLITARLAGAQLATDSSHALKTGLDLDSLEWPAAVLADLGIDVRCLPAVAGSGAVIGTVGPAAAAATGLPVGCAIVAGMTDGCAAQIGAGALEKGSWNSVLGTTLVVKGVSDVRRIDPSGAVYAHRAPFGAGWFPGGASSTGAGAVSAWLPGADLERCTASAAAVVRPPVAYPLVGTGERFPFVAGAATAFFDAGPDRPNDDDDLFAEIAYGVGYVERLSFDLLDLTGYDTAGPVTFTGGGATNPWWNQLRCDLLGRSVRVPAGADGAVGMALLAAASAAGDRFSRTAPSSAPSGRLARAADRMLGTAPVLEPDESR